MNLTRWERNKGCTHLTVTNVGGYGVAIGGIHQVFPKVS